MYFYLHILALIIFIVLMFFPTPKQGKPASTLGTSQTTSTAGQPEAAAVDQESHQNDTTSVGTDGTSVVKRVPHKTNGNETNGIVLEDPGSAVDSQGHREESEEVGGLGHSYKQNGKGGEGGGGGGLGIAKSLQPKIQVDLATKAE